MRYERYARQARAQRTAKLIIQRQERFRSGALSLFLYERKETKSAVFFIQLFAVRVILFCAVVAWIES